MLRSPPRIILCSSSSPEHKVGKGGKSMAIWLEFCVSTKRFRGSQKSISVVELMVLDCESGDGEGESEGQELMERGSEAWLAVTDGGWINTTDTTNSLDPRHFIFAFNSF